MSALIFIGALMGLGGTIAMDIWAEVLARGFGQSRPNWGFVGRWAAHLLRGRVFHDDIAAAEPVKSETALGWAVHYGVGIAYGIIFVALMGGAWLAAPVFWPLWIFSLLTIAAGWFLLHPGLGLGWAASRTPNPWQARIMGLVAHTVFAFGMWAVVILS